MDLLKIGLQFGKDHRGHGQFGVAALKAVCSECPQEHNAQAYYCVVEVGSIKSITCARVESSQLV